MKIPTVTINKRKLKDRRVSIYLSYRPAITDPVTKKDHAFETLGIYLWDKPRNDIEKEFNKQAMLRVEGIKSQRIISIIDNARTRALKAVNAELIQMYWSVGEYLSVLCANSGFGDKVIDEVASF